jgi:flagellar biosynthesis/type III secretory pathway protein FliH
MSLSKRSAIVRGKPVNDQEMLVLHGGAPGSDRSRTQDVRVVTAEALVQEAERRAATVLAEARTAAEAAATALEAEHRRLFAEARAEGFRAGHAEGLRAAAQETAPLLEALRTAARSGEEVSALLVAGAERQVVELALEVARKVLGHRAKVEPDLVLDMARRAIERARHQEVVRLRVNPEQQAVVAAMLARLPEGGFDVESDAAIDLGGCVVDTRFGLIDARLDTQVDQVGSALLALTAAFDE